jgi:DNA processing protein
MTERDYLLALHRIPELGPITLCELRDYFGSYERVWWAKAGEISGLLRRNQLQPFLSTRDSLDVGSVALGLDRAGISTLTILDDAYPALLREIHAPPPVLYLRGQIPQGILVTIVGTRRVTPDGAEVTRRIASELARAGVTVVSGLAFGVDIAAHRAALEAGGETVAVLASPVDQVTPATHRHEARRIISQGALVSEYAPGIVPLPGLFAVRNRVIAGLSRATVVVEAPRKSGALITAGHAISENRDVMAVPGPVLSENSAGTHALIRQGATLVRSGADVLEALDLPQAAPSPVAPPATAVERQIIEVLEGPTHFDTIALRTRLPAAELGSLLTQMEIGGRVRHLGANVYSK